MIFPNKTLSVLTILIALFAGNTSANPTTTKAPIREEWKKSAEGYWGFRSRPTVVNGIVYAGSMDFNVYAIDIVSGDERWKTRTDGRIQFSSPAVEDGKLFVGSEDGHLHALDALTGDRLWKYKTGGAIECSPLVASGKVYFGSRDSHFYCISAANGKRLWSDSVDGPVFGKPCHNNGKIFFGTELWEGKTLYALDAESGKEHFRVPTGGAIYSSIACHGNTVYFGSMDGLLYAINASDGETKWTFDTGKPVVSSPEVIDGVVYFSSQNKKFYAVKVEDGKEIWSMTPTFTPEDTAGWAMETMRIPRDETRTYYPTFCHPIVSGDTLYVQVAFFLFALDKKNGKRLWSHLMPAVSEGPGVVLNGDAIIAIDRHSVHCFKMSR